MFNPQPKTILYFYKEWQDIYNTMKNEAKNITFIDQFPQSISTFKQLISPYNNSGVLVVFDDCEQEIVQNMDIYKEIWTILGIIN